jgi:MFS family permease
VSSRELFAIGGFRALWSAHALSSAGDQLAQVSIGFVVYTKTGSPFLAGLAYALTYLPNLVGGPALAGLARAFPRQQIMIILDLARAGLVAVMALPGMPIPGLATLFFAAMLLGTPFAAARAMLLADVLPRAMQPAGSAVGQQTAQFGQIAGLLAGGGLVAALGPYRALALDSLSFSLSAGILACWVRPRPAPPPSRLEPPSRPEPRSRPEPPGRPAPPPRNPASRPAREITWAGVATIFGTPALRVLVLFGWLAGFTVVPEGLAAPYARTLDGGPPAIGLLLAAGPAGLLIGAFVLGRLIRPSERLRPMGWLAMLSCAPLVFCQVRPSLPVVAALWAVAGAGGAYQLAAAAAFVRALPRAQQVCAFAVAQSGVLAAQVLGILAAGAVAQRVGPQAAVALAGLLGLVAAAVLATDWIHRHAEVLALLDTPPPRLTAPGPSPRRPGPPAHRRAPSGRGQRKAPRQR